MFICLSVCRHIVNRFLCIIMSGITKTNVCNIIPQAIPNTAKSKFKMIHNYRYALQNSNAFSFTHCKKIKIKGVKMQFYVLKISIE